MSCLKFKSPKGTHDILPDEHLYFSFIKKVVRYRCRRSGFRRISTPVFEHIETLTRGIGEHTSLVEKEILLLENRNGEKFALRPEGTVGVARAYLQNNMQKLPKPVELYYIEPFFRYSQFKKKYQQQYQFGVEIIGENDPAVDAQVIFLAHRIHQDLGISDRFTIQINTVGSPEDQEKYKEDLLHFYTGKERSLCEDCKKRKEIAPLRLLDCKEEDCRILASMAPKFESVMSNESKEYYGLVLNYLDELGVSYKENAHLVRGFDYYTHTVFEFQDKKEENKTIGGGGRYDNLIESMGGQPTPAIGFAAEIEQVIAHMKTAGIRPPNKDKVHIFVAQLGLPAKKRALVLLNELRERGINTVGAIGKDSVKAQMSLAEGIGATYTLLLGQIEVKENTIILKDMKKGSQETISYKGIVDKMADLLGENKLENKKLWEE